MAILAPSPCGRRTKRWRANLFRILKERRDFDFYIRDRNRAFGERGNSRDVANLLNLLVDFTGESAGDLLWPQRFDAG